MRTITNRDMQNPDEPNLPFAQSLTNRDMQNPDEPNLPFAQRPSKFVYHDYIVNGDHWTFGKMVDKKVRWTEDNANKYRAYGYNVRQVSTTPLTASGQEVDIGGSTGGSSGLSRSQVEKIIESYHGDDISLLHSHADNFGKSLSASKDERDRIETKLDKAKAEHQNIWDSLGQKSDSSHFHIGGGGNGNGNGKDCGWDIGCHIDNFKEQIGGIAIIGGVVLVGYFLLKRRIRKP